MKSLQDSRTKYEKRLEKITQAIFGCFPTAIIGGISEESPAGVTKVMLEQIPKGFWEGLKEIPLEAL